MDLMDAPVEDGAMPSPADMGVGLDQEKMAAFDAAVNKRRDDEAALVTKNQAEAKSALAQLETERQTQFQGRIESVRQGLDPHLFAVGRDQTNLSGPDAVVDSRLLICRCCYRSSLLCVTQALAPREGMGSGTQPCRPVAGVTP